MPNYPGPYTVELAYIAKGLSHSAEYNCNVQGTPSAGDLPATITLETRDLVGVNLDTAVQAWVNILKNVWNSDSSFLNYTLWKYTPLSTQRTFISAGSLGVAGLATSPTLEAQQGTMTFRTAEGGTMNLVFLEHVIAGKVRVGLGGSIQPNMATLRDFVLSSSNWVLAKDTSYPIAGMNWSLGENEVLFRKRYRA